MEYAGKITQESNEQINAITTCNMAGGGSMVILFLRKANFSLQQRNIFYLTIMVVETTLRMVPPISIPIKTNYQPNKLI